MFLPPLLSVGSDVVRAEAIPMTLIPRDVVAQMGYHFTGRAETGARRTAKPAKGLVSPRYGTMTIGSRRVAFAISASGGARARLVVDTDGDGDLADESPVAWKIGRVGPYGDVTLRLGAGRTGRLSVYRDLSAPRSSRSGPVLLYYPQYGYRLALKLDGRAFPAVVAGDPSVGTVFGIDRDGDGEVRSDREAIVVGRAFNVTGTTYRIAPSPGGLTLETVTPGVPLTPPPPNLAVGRPALPILAPTLDGGTVDLSRDYRGKLVMLDFWATWCAPCIAELPNVKAAYAKHHAQGFDVLGISFDEADFAERLRAFTKAREMPWRQVYEGKGWKTKVGTDYDVNAIPFTLLVDGDTGLIVADGRNLRGPGLSDFIGKRLAGKKGTASR